MYRLLPTQIEVIRSLAVAGASVRDICTTTGHAKATVMAYRNAALAETPIDCACGKNIKHMGWCIFRFNKSKDRMQFIRDWARARQCRNKKCIDCGGPRCETSALRCFKCNKDKTNQRALDRLAAKTKHCKICDGPALFINTRWRDTCAGEWCDRIYAFYFVEGRTRPPTIRDAQNNGLKFELFLSDYIRRIAHEQATGKKHYRPTRCAVRGMGIAA